LVAIFVTGRLRVQRMKQQNGNCDQCHVVFCAHWVNRGTDLSATATHLMVDEWIDG
jgi:hypothetical protein